MAGEHGFRFFPAYYLHIWDMFQRIPVYQNTHRADGTSHWTPTSRTVYDNVRRVVTQGATADGEPSLIFPRELPRSPAEFLSVLTQLTTFGFAPDRCRDLREPAAALPRHQPATPRVRTAERLGIRLLRRARSPPERDEQIYLYAAVRQAIASDAKSFFGRPRLALG